MVGRGRRRQQGSAYRVEEEGRQVGQVQDRLVQDRHPRRLQLEVQISQEGRLPSAGHDRQDGHAHGRHYEVAGVQGEVGRSN